MNSSFSRGNMLLATSAITCMAAASPALAQERAFDIPAQSASTAVPALARQANVQVFAARKYTRGKRTNAVRGQMNVDQALTQLLKGTGLAARATGAQTYTVLPLAESASAPEVAPSRLVEAAPQALASLIEPDDSSSGEIVVTASKRVEKLRDVPSAITVHDGDRLDTLGVQSVRDYATLTPGLTVQDTGTPGYGKVFIRGLTSGSLQQSATTVYYLDDVPFTASSANGGGSFIAPEPELADIDRIEVLKGPQGTLYGASSLGGVVRLISKRPDPTAFSGSARAELTQVDGGGTGYMANVSLNIPLVTDRLAVRATGFYRRSPGYVDNLGTGTKNVNDSVSKGARLAIGWTPTDRLTIDVVGMIQNIDTDGLALEDQVPGTLTPLYGTRKYSNFFDAPTNIRYRLASVTGKYDVGIGEVIATGAYLESSLHIDTDVTSTYAPFFPTFGLFGYVYPPGTGVAVSSTIPQKKTTAELRFVSNRLGPVEFIAGGFYTKERATIPTDVVARDMATNTQLPGPLGFILRAPVKDRYEEISAFGNLTFYLTDDLDVTGGLRYADYKEDFTLAYGGIYYDAFFGGAPPPVEFDGSNDHLTYLATLRWRPTSTLSTFLRAASSFRPGGPQPAVILPPGAQTQIDPDTVWNYEAGIKADLLNRKLSIQASVFHIDWRDIQLYTIVQQQQLLANAGKARVRGFELQVDARPTPLLSIGANVGHTDARITEVDPGVTAVIGAADGDPIPQTPRWTASATADQLIPLGEDLQAQVGATIRLQGSKYTSFPGSISSPNIKLPGITTVDLRAGLTYRRYQLQLRAENIFNERGVISYTPNMPSQAYLIRPRSLILSLSSNF
ncbi:TonB-dependent receptor [Sphingosinicella rhizophila]|uniref:TonB-dependent receptor n=1 Tax=Sphingosinicella rhizophila TaxID=3050082 RepID=A0ABU3Q1S9_9SPHN|nr:TonB-dependent receptor [Sphingosinicella sp. GR2756]MDT9597378.1 TonB-dependent receptor [Sphingosinicella sp. GR2756]